MAGAVASRGVSAQTGTAIPWGPVCTSHLRGKLLSPHGSGLAGKGLAKDKGTPLFGVLDDLFISRLTMTARFYYF